MSKFLSSLPRCKLALFLVVLMYLGSFSIMYINYKYNMNPVHTAVVQLEGNGKYVDRVIHEFD